MWHCPIGWPSIGLSGEAATDFCTIFPSSGEFCSSINLTVFMLLSVFVSIDTTAINAKADTYYSGNVVLDAIPRITTQDGFSVFCNLGMHLKGTYYSVWITYVDPYGKNVGEFEKKYGCQSLNCGVNHRTDIF